MSEKEAEFIVTNNLSTFLYHRRRQRQFSYMGQYSIALDTLTLKLMPQKFRWRKTVLEVCLLHCTLMISGMDTSMTLHSFKSFCGKGVLHNGKRIKSATQSAQRLSV